MHTNVNILFVYLNTSLLFTSRYAKYSTHTCIYFFVNQLLETYMCDSPNQRQKKTFLARPFGFIFKSKKNKKGRANQTRENYLFPRENTQWFGIYSCIYLIAYLLFIYIINYLLSIYLTIYISKETFKHNSIAHVTNQLPIPGYTDPGHRRLIRIPVGKFCQTMPRAGTQLDMAQWNIRWCTEHTFGVFGAPEATSFFSPGRLLAKKSGLM